MSPEGPDRKNAQRAQNPAAPVILILLNGIKRFSSITDTKQLSSEVFSYSDINSNIFFIMPQDFEQNLLCIQTCAVNSAAIYAVTVIVFPYLL